MRDARSKRLFGIIPKRALRLMVALAILLVFIIATPSTAMVLAAHYRYGSTGSSSSSSLPTTLTSFPGAYNPNSSLPSDSVAAGPDRVVELVNGYVSITNRSGGGITDTLNDLAGTPGVFLSDQQVMWDPSSGRFYFSILENRGTSSPNEGIAWGFSKTSSPNGVGDFCSYFNNFNYGGLSYPDRQTLGDTQNFLLIGSDRYSTANLALMGSDLAWITKPGPGTNCPPQSSFMTGVQSLHNPDGTSPYGPVPAKQVDGSGTGWVVSAPSYYGSASYLSTYSVTSSPNGNAVVSPVNALPVSAFSTPPSAPQAGNTLAGSPASPLQTSVYLSGAYMSYDPRVGHTVIWTADTTAGGAGSEVRWYEINPSANTLDQSGIVSNSVLDVFDGSISPDRLVNGATSEYGSDAVVGFNTSSASNYTAIQMVSIKGTAQSPMQMIQQSPGPNVDFTCNEPGYGFCRWGDDSGSSPDPGAPTNSSSKTGQVWLSNQWNTVNTNDQNPDWRTTIWLAKP